MAVAFRCQLLDGLFLFVTGAVGTAYLANATGSTCNDWNFHTRKLSNSLSL